MKFLEEPKLGIFKCKDNDKKIKRQILHDSCDWRSIEETDWKTGDLPEMETVTWLSRTLTRGESGGEIGKLERIPEKMERIPGDWRRFPGS